MLALVEATDVSKGTGDSEQVSVKVVGVHNTIVVEPERGKPEASGPQPAGETLQDSVAPGTKGSMYQLIVIGDPSSTTGVFVERIRSGL